MISKELITEALRMYPQYSIDNECTGNIQYKPNSNVIHFEVNSNGMSQLNTYELAHKCKEWAWNKHRISLSIDAFRIHLEINGESLCFRSDIEYSGKFVFKVKDIIPYDPMLEIFVCQFILDNKDKS